ncbi:carbohydrate ABC transporter permease [Bacillus sp. Marseille-P3661]|uniref:carbohydrate ABC transporter permease n=1 Tax=Bacillus sp. Marseille-P3661 TaxID=1936234 RepID=UPI0021554E66|nr:carbohydrate ABC transporter permease [Bacillus sp. Marseille-P3661]
MKIIVKDPTHSFILHGFLILFTCIALLPIFWMISVSFKPSNEIYSNWWFLPVPFSIEGYAQVFEHTPFLMWLTNSVLITSLQTLGQVVLAFFAAYVFSRFEFPGRDWLFYLVLATMIIPHQAMMVPTYITVNMFNWVNTLTGVIVPFLASGYAIFLLRQFFLGVPKSLAEAAEVDGCGPLRILWYIYLPASIPALTALSIILFVNNWNEFYWPLLILMDENKFTLPVALVQFQNEGVLETVPTMAVATLSTIPVLALYFMCQKKFVEGFTNTGLKG